VLSDLRVNTSWIKTRYISCVTDITKVSNGNNDLQTHSRSSIVFMPFDVPPFMVNKDV